MSFSRPAELLLRQHSSLTHNSITSSNGIRPAVRPTRPLAFQLRSPLRLSSKRCFSQHSESAQQAAATAPAPSEDHSQSTERSPSTQTRPREVDISNLFTDILGRRGESAQRYTPMGKSFRANSSVMDAGEAMQDNINKSRQKKIGERMDNPSPKSWNNQAGPPAVEKTEPPPMRLGPRLGRTIKIDPNNPGKAFKQLDALCARNRIRADAAKQRFHERPGLKRKRLKSERYRRRFKIAFTATVARVKEMRRKGW